MGAAARVVILHPMYHPYRRNHVVIIILEGDLSTAVSQAVVHIPGKNPVVALIANQNRGVNA